MKFTAEIQPFKFSSEKRVHVELFDYIKLHNFYKREDVTDNIKMITT